MWGFSKDFGLAGFRLGLIHSYNQVRLFNSALPSFPAAASVVRVSSAVWTAAVSSPASPPTSSTSLPDS